MSNEQNSELYWIREDGSAWGNYSNEHLSWVLASPVVYDSMIVIASGSDYLLLLGNQSLIPDISSYSTGNPALGTPIPVYVDAEMGYQAYLYYRVGENERFKMVNMSYDISRGEYVGHIPAQNEPCRVQFYAIIVSDSGAVGETVVSTVEISEIPEFSPQFAGIIATLITAMLLARRKL